jgi:gliding motility-associated-like protein
MKVQLYIMDSNGCTQQNAFSLNTIDPLLTCFIPTAFTPDGNSLNEGFAPVGEFDRAVFEIYNRWGQLIFKSSSDQPYWDGNYQSQPAPEGVYIIRADIYWTGIRKKQYHSGKFQLLR